MAGRPNVAKLARSRAEAPGWALAVLEGWDANSGGRRLAANVRAAVEARRAGTAFPEGLKAGARRTLSAMWAFTVLSGFHKAGAEGRALSEAIGPYQPGRAMDTLARCLPFLATHPPGSEVRAALDRAIAFLDAAAAIEPVAMPQLANRARTARVNAAYAWSDAAGTALRGVHAALCAAVEAEPGIRPAGGAAGRPDAIRIPPVGKVWWQGIRPFVAPLIQGGHGLAPHACRASVRDGAARFDVILAREGVQAVVRTAYGPGDGPPRHAFGIGLPGAYTPVDADGLAAALHEARGDPPALRAASAVLAGLDHEAPAFAVEAGAGGLAAPDAGPDAALRLTTLPGALDAAGFSAALDRAEAAADRYGVVLEVGLAGQVASVADLLGRGYAYAGNRGETVMARAPAPRDPNPAP